MSSVFSPLVNAYATRNATDVHEYGAGGPFDLTVDPADGTTENRPDGTLWIVLYAAGSWTFVLKSGRTETITGLPANVVLPASILSVVSAPVGFLVAW